MPQLGALVDVTTVARNFPELPEILLLRENFLEILDSILQGGTNLIVLEGKEGVGKTTLLANFCRRHHKDTVALFVRASSKITYSQGYIRLVLAEQLASLLGRSAPTEEPLSDSFLQTAYFQLQRRYGRKKEKLYFVVDGLGELPEEERNEAIAQIFSLLPLGFSECKFIVSGDETFFPRRLLKGIRLKPYPLAPFHSEETRQFFSAHNISTSEVFDLHRLCEGIPGRLAIVDRLLRSGKTATEILGAEPRNLPQFISEEWSRIPHTEQHSLVLAIICFGLQDFTQKELSSIAKMSIERVAEIISDVPFVRLTSGVPSTVEIASDAHRRFLAEALSQFRNDILDRLITYSRENINQRAFQQALPVYLADSGRNQELLTLLSPEFLATALRKEWSLAPVANHAELGRRIAQLEYKFPETMQFSLIRSYVLGFSRSDVLRVELEALLAIDEFDKALELAGRCALTEDRVLLLALIEKERHKRRLPANTEVAKQISAMCEQIDPKILNDRAVEIAMELVYSNPDLALDLIEQAAGTPESPQGMDAALATISLRALVGNEASASRKDFVAKAREKIKDPEIQVFSDSISVLLSGLTAQEVIRETERFDTARRIYLLRRWALENRDRDDARLIVEFSLEKLVEKTDFAMKIKDLREMATPLPYLKGAIQCREVVGRIDALKTSVRNLSPTEDYARLELLLARTQSKYDFEAANLRTIELYYQISEIADLSTKTACLAWLLSSLSAIDVKGHLEKVEGLHAVVRSELEDSLRQLLLSSADHFEVAKRTIAAFARADYARAIAICEALNLTTRRDMAYRFFVKEALSYKLLEHRLPELFDAIEEIVEVESRERTLLDVFDKISLSLKTGFLCGTATHELLFNKAKTITHEEYKCKALAQLLYTLQISNEIKNKSLIDDVRSALLAAWTSVDQGWAKIRSGFEISKIIGQIDPSTAREFIERSQEYKSNALMDSGRVDDGFLLLLDLVVRCVSTLSRMQGDGASLAQKRLDELVKQIPSISTRAKVYGGFALRLFAEGCDDIAKTVVSHSLQPLLENLRASDFGEYSRIFPEIVPALYRFHAPTTLDLIRSLDSQIAEEAVFFICTFLMYRLPPSEPHDYEENSAIGVQSYEEFIDVINVLEEGVRDNLIYSLIKNIVEVIDSKSIKTRLSRPQLATIKERLLQIVNKKLPDKKNIQHDGYLVACIAELGVAFKHEDRQWDDLHDRALQIPNTADRAYVLGVVATSRPWKKHQDYEKAIDGIFEIIEKIPVDIDRIDRYELLAERLSNSLPGKARVAIKRAFDITANVDERGAVRKRQNVLLDLAHKIDPKFAEALADIVDDDPARLEIKRESKQRLEILKLRDEINDHESPDAAANANFQQIVDAAWMNLRSLNSGRINAQKDNYFFPLFKLASGHSFEEAYPIYAWAIASFLRRRRGVKRDDGAALFSLTNGLLSVVEFSAKAVREVVGRDAKERLEGAVGDDTVDAKIFAAGERVQAIQFIRNWMESVEADELIVCDPYFNKEDLELLRIILESGLKVRVRILSDYKKFIAGNEPITDDRLSAYWRTKLSDQAPPETEIILLQADDRVPFPIHDRWILARQSGIRMGTSFSGLGNRLTGISLMNIDEVKLTREELNPYLTLAQREVGGYRVRYHVYSM